MGPREGYQENVDKEMQAAASELTGFLQSEEGVIALTRLTETGTELLLATMGRNGNTRYSHDYCLGPSGLHVHFFRNTQHGRIPILSEHEEPVSAEEAIEAMLNYGAIGSLEEVTGYIRNRLTVTAL